MVQDDIDRVVGLLETKGQQLPFPLLIGDRKFEACAYARTADSARGQPYRVFYAFDPRRTAIPLVAGYKVGVDRFYETMIPIADALYDDHTAHFPDGAVSIRNFSEIAPLPGQSKS